jgi:hypothetical protein
LNDIPGLARQSIKVSGGLGVIVWNYWRGCTVDHVQKCPFCGQVALLVAWVHAFPDCLHDPVPLPRAKPLTSGTAYPPSMVPMPPALPLHDFEAWPSDCGLRLAEIARFAPQPSQRPLV